MSAERITVAICRHCFAEDDLIDATHVENAGDDSDCSHVPDNGGWYKMVKRRVWMCTEPFEGDSPCGCIYKTRDEALACDVQHEGTPP